MVERFPLHLAATVKSLGDREADRWRVDDEALIENISSRGALFSSAARWLQQERVALLVSLGEQHVPPYRYDISLAGRVVRDGGAADSGKAWYAVEFEAWDIVNWEACETGGGAQEAP